MACSPFKTFLSVALVAVLGLIEPAYAQWQKVGPQEFTSPDPKGGCAISFADGIVWAGGHSLWRSDDLGLTWQLTSFPVKSRTIMGIYFFDRSNGFILSDYQTYMTTDGGTTWSLLPYHSSRWGAFGSTADTFYLSCSGQLDVLIHGVLVNQLIGTQWISPIVARHGSVYYLDSSVVYSSLNGGNTWAHGLPADDDCNAMAIDSCDPHTLYLVNEEIFIPSDNISGMFVSNDDAKSWTLKNPHVGYYYSGDLATSKNAVYTQTQDGIIRSTDKGETWISIGGPTGPPDNLSLAVVTDSILLAIDSFGNMWRTENDGGFPLVRYHEPPLLLTSTSLFDTDQVFFCDSLRTGFALTTKQCFSAEYSNATIVGSSAAAYSLSTYHTSSNDSSLITFYPIKSGKNDATLLIAYGSDTVRISLNGSGLGTNPKLVQSRNSLFQTMAISICDSAAWDLVTINFGCSLKHLTAATISGPAAAAYAIVKVSRDSVDNIDSFRIQYSPSDPQPNNAILTVTYDDGSTATIALAGLGILPSAPILAKNDDTLFTTAKLFTCEQPVPDSTLTLIQCNHRLVTTTDITGPDAANYALLRTSRNGNPDCDSFFVSFHPSAPGPSNGALTITYDNGTVLSVPLRGEGLANPKASVAAVDVNLKDTIGALVRVPIVISHDKALAAIEFRMLYDTSLLIFDRFASQLDTTLQSSELSPGIEALHTTVPSDSINDTLYAYFYWFPTTESVTIDSIDNIKAIPVGDGCPIDVNSTAASIITGPLNCTSSMLSHFVRYSQPPYLSIEPNPTTNHVVIHSSLKDPTVTLSDALGRIAYRSGATEQIGVADFPSGLYYIELQSGSIHITKPLIIAH